MELARTNQWSKVTVGEIASSTRNALVGGPFGSNLVSRDYVEDGVPVIRGQNMSERWVGGEFVYVTPAKAESLESNIARPGDIIFTQRGTLGQVSLVPEEPYAQYLISQSQMKLTVDREVVDPFFIYYVFLSKQQQDYIRQQAIQTGVPHTNLGLLRSTSLLLPPLSEQRAIAHILSKFDDRIELDQHMNKTLEAIGKTIFKHWFIDFEFPNEEDKPYKSSGGEMVYNEELARELPEGWTVEKLDKVCTLITDGSHFSPKEYQDGTKRIATITNMGEFSIDYEACKKISEKDFSTLVKNGCKVEKGDVLISKDGTMGKTLVYDSNEDLILLSSIAILRVGDAVSPYYLRYYLANESTQETLKAGYMSGSVLTRIVLKDLKQLRILIPSRNLVEEFDRISSTLHSSISKNMEQNRTLVGLRDLLLPKLMSGKIGVPVEAR